MEKTRRDFIKTTSAAALIAATGCQNRMVRESALCIRKLGTIDILIVESTPVIFKGRPYLMEYIRYKNAIKHYRTNNTGVSYLRFRDLTDMNTFTPPFGHGLHLASAFTANGRMYVTGTVAGANLTWGGSQIVQLESDDLVHWTKPRTILGDAEWQVYNTSVCPMDDGRHLMVFELGAPARLVGRAFTMFFAETTDLKTWKVIDGAVFGRDFYTGAPLVRHHAGWTYFFYIDSRLAGGTRLFRTRVARSRDLKTWDISPRTVLDFDPAEDKLIHPKARFTPDELEEIRQAADRNASDLDFCEHEGRLICSYSWGDQLGHEFLALGEVPATEREFCESFFR